MKKFLLFIFLSCAGFLSAACQQSPEVIQAKEQPVLETFASIHEEAPENLLLMQVESNRFPQSQGVYDFNHGTLTVVKQYLSDQQEREYLLPSDSQAAAIQKDFEQHFPEKTMVDDPFKVYEGQFKDVSLMIDEKKIELMSETFHKDFFYQDEEKTLVYDENYITYRIQYDNQK